MSWRDLEREPWTFFPDCFLFGMEKCVSTDFQEEAQCSDL